MSDVFRNIDPPTFGAGVGHTRWLERGWGVNSSEDARHCSVLYLCKYFVPQAYLRSLNLSSQVQRIRHRFRQEIKTLAHTCTRTVTQRFLCSKI
jgi:hypothetical protein